MGKCIFAFSKPLIVLNKFRLFVIFYQSRRICLMLIRKVIYKHLIFLQGKKVKVVVNSKCKLYWININQCALQEKWCFKLCTFKYFKQMPSITSSPNTWHISTEIKMCDIFGQGHIKVNVISKTSDTSGMSQVLFCLITSAS